MPEPRHIAATILVATLLDAPAEGGRVRGESVVWLVGGGGADCRAGGFLRVLAGLDCVILALEPFYEFVGIDVNVGTAAAGDAVHRKAARDFPSLYGALVASEKRADFFPGIQAAIGAYLPVRGGHFPICPDLPLYDACPRTCVGLIIPVLCFWFAVFGMRESLYSAPPSWVGVAESMTFEGQFLSRVGEVPVRSSSPLLEYASVPARFESAQVPFPSHISTRKAPVQRFSHDRIEASLVRPGSPTSPIKESRRS